MARGRVGGMMVIGRRRDRHPPLYLPQLGELELPRPMDVAGGVLLYDGYMKRVYLADAQTDSPPHQRWYSGGNARIRPYNAALGMWLEQHGIDCVGVRQHSGGGLSEFICWL